MVPVFHFPSLCKVTIKRGESKIKHEVFIFFPERHRQKWEKRFYSSKKHINSQILPNFAPTNNLR